MIFIDKNKFELRSAETEVHKKLSDLRILTRELLSKIGSCQDGNIAQRYYNLLEETLGKTSMELDSYRKLCGLGNIGIEAKDLVQKNAHFVLDYLRKKLFHLTESLAIYSCYVQNIDEQNRILEGIKETSLYLKMFFCSSISIDEYSALTEQKGLQFQVGIDPKVFFQPTMALLRTKH